MMKRIIPIVLVLVLLVSVLPVTAFAASGTSRYDAIPVVFEEPYTHTWNADNDEQDHYISFTMPSRGLLGMACSYPVDDGGDCGDMVFEIYNQSGTCIWRTTTDYESKDEDLALVYLGLNAGKFYMNIIPEFTVVSGEFQIAYALTFAAADDTHGTEAEPNNSKTMADTMTAGKEFVGSIGENCINLDSTCDYWKYSNTSAAGYRVYFPELAYFKPDGKISHEDSAGNITNIDLTKDVRQTADGVYYFDVKSTKGTNYLRLENDGGVLVPYTIWIEPFKNEPLTITKQPESVTVTGNVRVTVSVEATGELLSYTWYAKNYGETEFTATSVHEKEYQVSIGSDPVYQEAYCLITDAHGNTIKSDTVTLCRLLILQQPSEALVAAGEVATVQFQAVGDTLTYQWYAKDKGASSFSQVEGFTTNTYSVTMDAAVSGRQLYCVVTDKFGNTKKTATVAIAIPEDLRASGTCGDNVTWKLTFDGLLTISGTGPMQDYYRYQSPWHEYQSTVRNIVIEEGVTAIGNAAFMDCSNALTADIPETVKTIGTSAFNGCHSLTTLIIPEGVTTIGEYAFQSSGIRRIAIPVSVTSIENNAFYSCDDLRSVYYAGTDRSAITIGQYNDDLLSATWHYGYDGGELFIPGDLDGDGEISDWDGVLLARHLAGWTVEIADLAAADVDGDGEVTDWDSVVLDRYLAGWNVTIG